MFYGLAPLGVAHTVVSLIAVTTGLIALIRGREISPRNVVGKLYVIMTVLTCLTAFGSSSTAVSASPMRWAS